MYFTEDLIYGAFEYLRSGGIIMLPLALVSFFMWVLILNRFFLFRKMSNHDISVKNAREYIIKGTCPDLKKNTGLRARFTVRFLKKASGNSSLNNHILDEIVISFAASLDKYLSVISVLAGIAPLLGLLGTVTGMVTTFSVISIFGTGNAKAMAAGISEALITTQSGLVVAIPGFYMSNYLYRKSNSLKHKIASTAIHLKTYI